MILAWTGVALCLGGCAGGGSTVLGPTPANSVSPVSSPQDAAAGAKSVAKPVPTRSLAAVHSWTQTASFPATKPDAALAALAALPEDLLIVDPAAVPTAPPASKDNVSPLPKPLAILQGNGQRRVLALLDIGEMAKTNPAWKAAWVSADGKLTPNAPGWLEAPAAKSADAYPIKFWEADWQKRLTAALDKLLDAGYNGVSLQDVSAFSHDLKGRPAAGSEMASLVEALAARARKRDPNFSVLIDGGQGLPAVLTDAQRKDFLAAVDGALGRDVFYSGDKPADNELAPQADVLAALDTLGKAGKTIFVTERLTDPDKIADFVARAKSHGWLPDSALAGAKPPVLPASGPQVAANTR